MQTDAMRFAHGQLPGALELAFVGDSVYDLYVRSHLVAAGGGHMREVHLAAVRYVNAHAQSQALARVEPLLTEKEAGVVRRARNARQIPTKNADAREYHRATALEALIGYLYLTEQRDRMEELLEICMQTEGQE